MIRFNKPYVTGNELRFMAEVIAGGHLAGDGSFTRRVTDFFRENYGFRNSLLTTSATHALEMTALLMDIREGDEVIVPAYTFVSTVNAFVLRGAKIVFADSLPAHPNIDPSGIEALITLRTRAIVVVHYGGVACDMDPLLALAARYNLVVIEDAANSIDAFYKGRALGTIGTFGVLSFHETKNVVCGEGGLLAVNADAYLERAEVIREKGTNRSAFVRGEVNKYSWVDIGSSYLLSELLAAFLYAQLGAIPEIRQKRISAWETYRRLLAPVPDYGCRLPEIPAYATNNAHLFYLLCPSAEQRSALITFLAEKEIKASFHYLPLHLSPYYRTMQATRPELPNAESFGNTLLRLPLYPDITEAEQQKVADAVLGFLRR